MVPNTIRSLYNQLKPVQQTMLTTVYELNKRKYVYHCSRRLGKTHLLCTMAIIEALNKPGSQIRYASVTQKAVKKMTQPILRELFKYVPKPLQPSWNSMDSVWTFPNGSQVHVAGVNNGHADDLRGTSTDLFIIDEAAFVDSLSYLVDSVAIPQLLTVQGSRLIMASSSPLSPAHEFVHYIQEAKAEGGYFNFPIHAGGYAPDLIAEFMKEAGGSSSTTWKREYLNELTTDDKMSVVPEWNKECVKEVHRDRFWPYYHKYASADWGVRDKTGILWGYYDFQKAQLIIEQEFSISGPETTTKRIAAEVKQIESDLGYTEVYKRVADNNNLLLLNDLANDYNLHFAATTKEDLAAMVNKVRLWAQSGRIIVHPRCKELAGCLEYGIYLDEKRREFGRSKVYGHFDLLASLIYLIRNIDEHINTVPINLDYTARTFNPKFKEDIEANGTIKKIFNL